MANLGITEGLPYPLGATWVGKGVNFALFSAHATRVEVCLFDQAGEREDARIELPEYTNEIWHGYVLDAHPGTILAIAYMAPMSRKRAIGSIRTNFCSIPMPAAISAICDGTPPCSATKWRLATT